MITINVPPGAIVLSPDLSARLDDLAAQVTELGAQIMARFDDQHALLDDIGAYTNTMAVEAQKQTAVMTEIGADVDALLASTTDETIKPKLEALKAKAEAVAAASVAQTATLQAIAAKHDEPLPPPVVPTP